MSASSTWPEELIDPAWSVDVDAPPRRCSFFLKKTSSLLVVVSDGGRKPDTSPAAAPSSETSPRGPPCERTTTTAATRAMRGAMTLEELHRSNRAAASCRLFPLGEDVFTITSLSYVLLRLLTPSGAADIASARLGPAVRSATRVVPAVGQKCEGERSPEPPRSLRDVIVYESGRRVCAYVCVRVTDAACKMCNKNRTVFRLL